MSLPRVSLLGRCFPWRSAHGARRPIGQPPPAGRVFSPGCSPVHPPVTEGTVPLPRAAGLLLGLCLLFGCGETEGAGRGGPTAPGLPIPTIRGVYSAPSLWTFETLRLADGAQETWNCVGSVSILRQSGVDFFGRFTSSPPDPERCDDIDGDINSGVVLSDARISFATTVPGQDGELFALPGCALVTQDLLWTGSIVGERLVASRGATVDCPTDGRVRITSRIDGPRTTNFD